MDSKWKRAAQASVLAFIVVFICTYKVRDTYRYKRYIRFKEDIIHDINVKSNEESKMTGPEETIGLKCSCSGKMRKSSKSNQTLCSDYNNARGYGQKVVSYAVYGEDVHLYLDGLLKTVEEINELLPGWIVLVYAKVEEYTAFVQDHQLCTLHCLHPHVDICNVNRLPAPLNSIPKKMLWRIIPMMDPLVDVMLPRDSDSPVIGREKAAVEEWLDSPWMLHGMRDYPLHNTEILGGMWGIKSWMNRQLSLDLATAALFEPRGKDQWILRDKIWPTARKMMLCHDSYLCTSKRFKCAEMRPFPTRRNNGTFVGNLRDNKSTEKYLLKHECPKTCRPSGHMDWKYC